MRLLLLPFAMLALAACQPASTPDTTPSPDAATARPTLNPLPEPPDATPIQASYACAGNRVDLVNDSAIARIAMNDGRVVNLGGMRGSTPATWRDVGLTFTIDERNTPLRITLAQDDGPVLQCEPLPEPLATPAQTP